MMIQSDEGNLVITMGPSEAAALILIGAAVANAMTFGLDHFTESDLGVVNHLFSAPYRVYSDQELIEHLVAPHLDHPGDDIEGMRDSWAPLLAEKRQVFLDADLLGE